MSAAVLRVDEAIGAALDRVFAPGANPWRHLGALAFLSLVTCTVSGLYLYALFDTSAAGAYQSGLALDGSVPGRLVRGVHRYSADALVVFTGLHLAREAARGHFRAHRAWSWVSGVVLVPLSWVAGITGFWLAWDERALASAAAVAEWLAAWPWHAVAFTRDFTGAGLTDRFFSLVVFLHIGLPLAALAATWAHFQRLSHVRAWPPAALGVPLVAALAVLALAHPVASLGPAEAFSVPASLAVDWFFFFPHPLARAWGPGALGLALSAGLVALAVTPWAARRPRQPAACVDLANCNGCARCAADCPFGAVVMVPRSDGRRHAREARVDPDLCSACGMCAGACPSATPLRTRTPLVNGIDLPAQPMPALRQALDAAFDAGRSPVVFACAGARASAGPQAIAIECAAMLPPSFGEYALRRGASGVVVAACREGDCEHRLGDRWMRERLAGTRAPRLRAVVPRARFAVVACGSDARMLAAAVAAMKTPEGGGP